MLVFFDIGESITAKASLFADGLSLSKHIILSLTCNLDIKNEMNTI